MSCENGNKQSLIIVFLSYQSLATLPVPLPSPLAALVKQLLYGDTFFSRLWLLKMFAMFRTNIHQVIGGSVGSADALGAGLGGAVGSLGAGLGSGGFAIGI